MAVTLRTDLSCDMMPWTGVFDERIRTAWEQVLVTDPHASIFHHPEWLDYACQSGVAHPSHLLMVGTKARLHALIPLQRRTPWTWEVPAPMSAEYPVLLLDPESEEMVWMAFAQWFRAQSQISMLHLGAVAERHVEPFSMACQALGLIPRRQPASIYVNIPLAGSWEAHLAELGKSTRSKLRRADTHLQNAGEDFSVDFPTAPPMSEQALNELIRLYRARWDCQLGGSAFSRAHHEQFYRQFFTWATQQGYAVAPIMRLQGHTLAAGIVYHLPGQDKAYFHLIARDADALPNHWLNTPGLTLVSHVIRWAIERRVQVLGMGVGNAPYKKALGGIEAPLQELSVARTPLADAVVPHLDRGLHLLRRLPAHIHYRLCGGTGKRQPDADGK